MIIVGNLSYIITGRASLQGRRAGTAAFTINRAPFGPLGGQTDRGFNWTTQVGYEIEGLALVVLAGLALFSQAGIGASIGLKIGLVIAAAAVQLVLPLFGHKVMLRTLRRVALPFIALFIVFAVLSIGKVNLGAGHNAGVAEMLAALAIILSAGGYGWQMNANDFSGYPPPDTSTRKIVRSVAIGGYIPSALLELLGAALYTIPAVAMGGGGAVSGLPHDLPWDQALAGRAARHDRGRGIDRVDGVLERLQRIHHRLPRVHADLDRAVGGDLPGGLPAASRALRIRLAGGQRDRRRQRQRVHGRGVRGCALLLLARRSVPDEAEKSALGDPPEVGLDTAES